MQQYSGNLELNWINKDKSLHYIYDSLGNPKKPIWVSKDDLKVTEPRTFTLLKEYGNTTNLSIIHNTLIQGDNLLALKTLIEIFKQIKNEKKVQCIYIDPPYNTGNAFENYEDNLENSQWLTMIRDRLVCLKELLKPSGAICIQLNHLNIGRLKCLMDEIFGIKNFVQMITIETSDPSGHATVNPGLYDASEFILIYAKDKNFLKYNTNMRIKTSHDVNYNKVVTNKDQPYTKWKIEKIEDVVAKKLGFTSYEKAQKKIGKYEFKHAIETFALNNSQIVYQSTAIGERAGKSIIAIRDKSKSNKGKVFLHKRKNNYDVYIYNGREMYFYEKKVKIINGKFLNTKPLTNIWTDISWNGISKEGNVVFKRSKKPEKLIKRILELFTEKNDLVLDSFLGSGTTAAVAHKMNRFWIGIELGAHAKQLCAKRLEKICSTNDTDLSGISRDKNINWKGGGGFRFFKLEKSLIKNGKINFSKNLKKIAQALFLNKGYIYTTEENSGLFIGKSSNNIAICSISKTPKIISSKEFNNIIKDYISIDNTLTFYTNNGVNVNPADLPENIKIQKITPSLIDPGCVKIE